MNPLYAKAWSDPSLRASRPGRGFYRHMRWRERGGNRYLA
jgi:hypothetical protein